MDADERLAEADPASEVNDNLPPEPPAPPAAAAPGTHAPWAIKSIAREASSAALSAAKRNKLPVGRWLELAIRTRIQAELESERQPAVIYQEAPPPDISDISDIERLIVAAANMAHAMQEPPPRTLASLAYRALRRRLVVAAPPRRPTLIAPQD